MGLIGFMNTLCLEGQKYDIKINAISPVAATRMTEDILPPEAAGLLTPECVTAGVLTLCDKDAPNHTILCAGAGGYAQTIIYETDGVFLSPEDQTPENIRANMDKIGNPEGQESYFHGGQQTFKFLGKAGVKIG
jgi:NAD(P)-dependent dehydrogenase (short-subunit alcohol dehydrogenase family)